MSTITKIRSNHRFWSNRKCIICGSQAVGVNFGVLTCAPCKAFFRRNARRREVIQIPCYHLLRNNLSNSNVSSMDYFEIRRCSSCRLIRCFAMGMKEELVRTVEENARYKQLINANRQRKQLLEKKQRNQFFSTTNLPLIIQKIQILNELDWRYLSNIVSAYDTYCLNKYIQQRTALFKSSTSTSSFEHAMTFSMNLTISLYEFLRSLPAFYSLSLLNQIYLCKNHFSSLLFSNFFELKQTCFSEPWQISLDNDALQWICGSQLYEQFLHTENSAEKLLITDPVVTRLWLVVLFFSPSLSCIRPSNRSFHIARIFTNIRNTYLTLLYKYLLHRYGDDGSVRIYFNLIFIYMKMQNIAFDIGTQIQNRSELMIIYQNIDQYLTQNIRNNQ